MTNELAKVPFYGDELDAVQSGDKVWVSLKRCCDNLGIDPEVQRRKLRGKAWAVAVEMTATGGDGKQYQMTMVDLETLPGWLFSIDARKVAGHVREKLARYQREAAKVLANHFLSRQANTVSVPHEVFEKLVGRVEHLQLQLDRLASVPPAIMGPAVPRFTVQQRLEWKGWPEAPRDARKKIRRLAVARIDANFGDTPDQAGGPGGGGPLRFHAQQLCFLDSAIDEVREAYAKRERGAGPNLFSSDAA